MSVPQDHKPCENCPWRKDAKPAHWHKDHFSSIWKNCQDDGMSMMMCHKSKPGKEVRCSGFIRVVGFQSIALRIAAMQGTVNTEQCGIGGEGLYQTFEEMMLAQGFYKKLPARNKVKRRMPRGHA